MDIKASIKKYGYTLSMVAKEMGITQSALSQQINNGSITFAKVERIASIVGVPLEDFIGGEDFFAIVKHGDIFHSVRSLVELRKLVDNLEKE